MKNELWSIAALKKAYSNKVDIDQLSNWYLGQCDGSWEHTSGIEIDTLDNSGWAVKIDLTGTHLVNKSFQKIELLGQESDWLVCEILNNRFVAACGPAMLSIVVGVFLEWATLAQLE